MDDLDGEYGVSRIEDGLYQSGFVPRYPDGVSAVLNLCLASEMAQVLQYYPSPFLVPGIREYAWRPIEDNYRNLPSTLWLHETAGILDSWRQQGRVVVVHCAAGVSRSTVVVAAHLVRRYGMSSGDALALVKRQRKVTNPNPGLVALLGEYERRLLAGSTFPPSPNLDRVPRVA
jgi:protein-tyrosine phosphatase